MSTSSTSGSASRVQGLVSGFDTQSIVESFMAMEKIPMTKLENKKATEDLKLQAYQAVNTYLLKFRTSMNTLASKKLWNSKAAVTTNEKVITASANEYAVNGSYSFKVAQLATATQYMSKGFASKSDPLVKLSEGQPNEKLGTINLSSGKSRVDNSAELESLNGGKGVYRGSVRITDASNTTSVIDLSSCTTMDDVVRTLNESQGAQITASLKEGRLVIEDASNGSGAMKITNVGTGTTATDLGIIGTSEEIDGKQVIEGRNVYIMGSGTALKDLNDGLGVEEGKMTLRVSNGSGSYWDVTVDTTGCKTVGDLTKKFNDMIAKDASNGDAIHPNGYMAGKELEGLRFGVSEDGTSFGLSGTKAGLSYEWLGNDTSSSIGQAQPVVDLGLYGTKVTAKEDGEMISYDRVLGGVNSPMLKNLSGANGTGVGIDSDNEANYVTAAFNKDTLLSTLNGGKGLDLSVPLQFLVYEGGKNSTGSNVLPLSNVITSADINQLMDDKKAAGGATLDDLVTLINDKITEYSHSDNAGAQALVGMSVDWDADTGALTWKGAQSGYEYEIGGSISGALGLQRNANTGTLGTNTENGAQNEAIYDFMNGDRLISGNNFLNRLEGEGDDAHYAATMTELVNWATSYPRYTTDPVSGEEVDNPMFMVHDTDDEGNLLYDDDGDPVMVFDTEGWETMCKTELMNGGIEAALGSGFSMTIGGHQVDVSWDSVLDAFKDDGGVIDWSNVKVEDFLAEANKAISAATKTVAENDGVHLIAPELGINSLGTGFGWKNVDWSKTYDITGMDAFGLNASMSTDPDMYDKYAPRDDPALVTPYPAPAIPGFTRSETITTENAADHTLSEINGGMGLQIEALAGESINLDIDGTTVEIKIDDVIAKLKGGDPDLNINSLTIEDYVNALNDVTKTAMEAEFGAGADAPSFSWGIRNSGLAITDAKNMTNMTFNATKDEALGLLYTGVGVGQGYSVDFSEGSTAVVGSFLAVTFHPSEAAGIGSIDMSLGNGDTVSLSTDGLTTSSTLNDLIDKLNSELDALASGAHADSSKYTADELKAFKDIRFTINDTGTGIAVDNTSNKVITFHDTKAADGGSDNNTLAQDLGLIKSGDENGKVEAYSFQSGGSLGRNYVSRATSLTDWIGTDGEKGPLQITDATGRSAYISMEGCETIGDVIDAINRYHKEGILGVEAKLNDTGDGIQIFESYSGGVWPAEDQRTENIKIEDSQGGVIAQKLGMSGTGAKTSEGYPAGYTGSVIDGKLSKTIEVYANDSLEDVMYRMSEAGYKAAIINDGTSSTPYRLTVAASTTGAASDFVIESDIDLFGFNQTQRGRDSKVLYGDPNSSSSPVMLSSSTNSNSNAILGLTLDLKSVSNEWTTITVDTDKTKVSEEIKTMVSAYNDLSNIIKMLDGYDEETGEKGILYNDTATKRLMDEIDEFFYQVFDPSNLGIGSTKDGKQATWTWQDLGISLTSVNSNTDGSGNWFSVMDLDEDALEDMISSKWDQLSAMMAGERNIADSNAEKNVRPSASFNGSLAAGYDTVTSAINGNSSKSGWGVSNGIMADDTIENGADTYTVIFQQATTISRMNVFHQSSSTSLQDYDIEYLNPKTGEWEKLRSITGNQSDTNYLSVTPPTEVSGLRIVAKTTNAEDGKFRLLEFQAFEETGLAGQLNRHVNSVGDTREGFLATQNTEIQNTLSEIEEQMEKLQNRLDAKEESLWRKFTAMEVALGKLQNQSSYFSSMLPSTSSSK